MSDFTGAMKKFNKNIDSWTEKYRPTTIDDVVLSIENEKLFKSIVDKKTLPNLILHGGAGIGKTSIAKALANDLEMEYKYINASKERGIDTIRNIVSEFAFTKSFFSGTGINKMIILDEAEKNTNDAQDSLKVLIEETISNCRFVFCTNNASKIIDPLHSRCTFVSYDYNKPEIKKDILIKYYKRIKWILENEKVQVDGDLQKIILPILGNEFPDFSKIRKFIS